MCLQLQLGMGRWGECNICGGVSNGGGGGGGGDVVFFL